MRGNTATIDVVRFRADWDAHTPIAVLCVQYTVTKDQIIRLRDHWQLSKRLNRSLRYKPKRQRDPTPREIAQTCREIQAKWDDATREDRAVIKPQGFRLRVVPVNNELRELVSDDDE
jgi:hypothetical protein